MNRNNAEPVRILVLCQRFSIRLDALRRIDTYGRLLTVIRCCERTLQVHAIRQRSLRCTARSHVHHHEHKVMVSNCRVRYPPQTGSTHDACAVGCSCYPPSKRLSPNAPFFVAGDRNGRPIQKSADGAIPTIAYKVRVWSAIPPRYALMKTVRTVFAMVLASLHHVRYVKCK